MTPGRLLALTLLGACLQPSFAARPLTTDDAGVIAAGGCELEAGRTLARIGGTGGTGDSSAGETGATLACGLPLGAQVGLGYGQARGPQGRSRSLALAAKAGVWAGQGADAAALALSGALGWGRAAGQGWQREASELRLIGTQPFRYGQLHANLGHARSHTGGPSASLWGLALEHRPFTLGGLGWAPLAEVYGDDRGDRWVNVGVRTSLLPDQLFVDLAHARQQALDKARVWTLGLRFAF